MLLRQYAGGLSLVTGALLILLGADKSGALRLLRHVDRSWPLLIGFALLVISFVIFVALPLSEKWNSGRG
jgi:hypothetical protein